MSENVALKKDSHWANYDLMRKKIYEWPLSYVCQYTKKSYRENNTLIRHQLGEDITYLYSALSRTKLKKIQTFPSWKIDRFVS